MAPLPTIEDVYRIALKWNVDNVVNVIHVHAASAVPVDVFDAINTHVDAGMWSPMSNGNKIQQVDITPLFADSATQSYLTDGSTKWGGTQTGDIVMAGCAVVSMKTTLRGPANRGRVYVGPVTEAANNNGFLIAGQSTNMVTKWTSFQTGLIAESMEQVVASYKHSTAITVLTYSVRPALGTQRRRQSRLAA